MAQHISLKTALLILSVFAVFSIAGTYFALTAGKAGPLVTGFISATATVNVSDTVAISMVRSVVSFGNQTLSASNETSSAGLSNTPLPFTVQNDGNLWTNVTISATDLFSSAEADNPTYYYRLNSSLTGGEASTLNGTCALGGASCANGTGGSYNITWINVPETGEASSLIIAGMNYANASDLVAVNINMTVPSVESAGNKTSTVTFLGTAY